MRQRRHSAVDDCNDAFAGITSMNAEMVRCLESLDIQAARGIWGAAFPHFPTPASDDEFLTMLHMARTQSSAVMFKLRAYSHRWLTERDLPSQLPDHLKPSAERLYPRVASAVGISYNFHAPELQPAAVLIRGAMEGAVLEADADGKLTDAPHVKTRMYAARDRERKALFGRVGLFKIGAV